MKAQTIATQSVRALTRSQYVCRQCKRSLYSSARNQALFDKDSAFGRLRNLLTGTKEAEAAKEERDKATEEKKERIEAGEVQAETMHIGDKEFEVASAITTHPDYQEKKTWEGMERIGSPEWLKAQLDQGEVYESFIPTKADLSPSQWRKLLRHIVIEELLFLKNQTERRGSNMKVTSNATVSVDGDAVDIKFANATQEQAMLEAEDEVDLQSLDSLPEPTDPWMKVPLRDPALKFAVAKRVLQITGLRIPDMAINAEDLRGLYSAALVKPKPKKLAVQLHKLTSAPNVTVRDQRWTAIDKDKESGRWKLIEKELARRNLPVSGTRWKDAKMLTQV